MLRDRALVLRRFAWGESSLVVQVLAREHGRVHLVAKGAHRPTSRYFGVLDLFHTVALEASTPRGAELLPLRAAELDVRRATLTGRPSAYRAAHAVLELTDLAARPAQPAPELFDAAAAALDRIESGARPPELAQLGFELRFLDLLGLAPALTGCAACGRAAPAVSRTGADGRAAFSAGAGGRLCRACAEEARAAGRRVGTLPVAVLEAAAAALGAARGEAPDPPAHALLSEAAGIERVRDAVARFVEYHLEARPRTYRRFLAGPNRNRPEQESARPR